MNKPDGSQVSQVGDYNYSTNSSALPIGSVIVYLPRPYGREGIIHWEVVKQSGRTHLLIVGRRANLKDLGLEWFADEADFGKDLGLERLASEEDKPDLAYCSGINIRDPNKVKGFQSFYMIEGVGLNEVPYMLQKRGPGNIRTVITDGSLYVLPKAKGYLDSGTVQRVADILLNRQINT